jgi:hypothetical protein
MSTTPEALADRITKKAADTLAGLDREMTIMKWPPEFRSIMWEAVAAEARARAIDDASRAEQSSREGA